MTDDPTGPLPPGGGDPSDLPPGGPDSARPLRRAEDDRVLAGLAGGLGRYFGIDPVLFRVLFAVSAFFGGAGLLAYLLGWALIPDEGAVNPPIDRFVDELRRRSLAFWVVVGVFAVVFWTAMFQAWQPLGFGPVGVAVLIVVIALARRTPAGSGPGSGLGDPSADPTVEQTATAAAGTGPDPSDPVYAVADPTQLFGVPPDVRKAEAQARIIAARTAARESQRIARLERRQRMAPARWGSFGAIVLTLGVLGILDATRGIPISTYGWALVVVGLAALIIGGLFRRTPWLNLLWVFAGACIIATFGTTSVSALDGTGDQLLAPRSAAAVPDDIELAFGRTTLDLTGLPAGAGRGQTVDIRQAAGAVVIRVPDGARVAIHADVHLGAVTVNEARDLPGGRVDEGREFDAGPSGRNVFTIDANLAVGVIEIHYVGRNDVEAVQPPDPVAPADPVEPADPVDPAEPARKAAP